jgi:hypothetical protein
MSVDAAGTFRDLLTFSIWKGRNYVRTYSIPTNPRTTDQQLNRNLFYDAVDEWKALYSGTQEEWNVAAREVYPPISGFNYWMMQYMLQSATPTIPAVAPRRSKTIHKSSSEPFEPTP